MSLYRERRRRRAYKPPEGSDAMYLCKCEVLLPQSLLRFSFRMDGDDEDEDDAYAAELRVAGVRESFAALEPHQFVEAVYSVAVLVSSWLFMKKPRRILRIQPHCVVRSGPGSGGLVSNLVWTPEEAQLQFWEETLRGSLSEFLYVNRIAFSLRLEIVTQQRTGGSLALTQAYGADAKTVPPHPLGRPGAEGDHEEASGLTLGDGRPAGFRRVLVPLGGGKDALALVEFLRDAGVDIAEAAVLFHMSDEMAEFRKSWRIRSLARQTGCRRLLRAELLPPFPEDAGYTALFEANDEELIDTAPPWAALVAFASVFCAVSAECAYICVGNERSANFGNGIRVPGSAREVNHQYDKSFAWERLANGYIRRHISAEIFYFSGLMHLWEIQIAQRFCQPDCVRERQYLSTFISCNTPQLSGFDTRWCAKCPKCVFVYILISAFLRREDCMRVFGDDLYSNEQLLPVFRALLGIQHVDSKRGLGLGQTKPLECVGEAREARAAFKLAYKIALEASRGDLVAAEPDPLCLSLDEASDAIPVVLQRLAQELDVLEGTEEDDNGDILEEHNAENSIPRWFWRDNK